MTSKRTKLQEDTHFRGSRSDERHSEMNSLQVFDDPDYVILEASRLGGKPVFFDKGEDQDVGLVAQDIPDTNASDLVSVYGYPDSFSAPCGKGPIDTNARLDRMAEEARRQGQIAAYLRLGLAHETPSPLPARDVTDASAILVEVGEVVTIDLAQSIEQLMAGYRKQLRYDLRRSPKLRFDRSVDVDAFHKIYCENMQRVDASGKYFFSVDYLFGLCRLPGVELWLAHDADGVVAGGIFLQQGERIYYHLGATANRALAMSPLKHLLHDRITALAQSGPTCLILGGGRGGENDALLRFKRGFSRQTLPVHALRVIFDPVMYARISDLPQQPPSPTGFFPAYRAP